MSILGKIVKSNSHTDYICQIFSEGEADYIPQNTDYAFGTFVRIDLDEQGERYLVGLVYDTVLLNPDFGRLGPRLSSESDLQIFSPDYLNERAVLIGILVIGQCIDDHIKQGIPRLAATNEAQVSLLDPDNIRQFHIMHDTFQLTYLPNILQQAGLLAQHLTAEVIDQLTNLLPEQTPILQSINNDLQWRLHINGMRGS